MKKPTHQHLPRCEVYRPEWADDRYLHELADSVFYRGSEDHKDAGNSFGFLRTPPRKDASVCDNGITPEQAQEWLRDSIRRGNINWAVLTEKYPRYVWGIFNDQLYLGRLTNDGKGEYKGYPVQESVTIKGLAQ